MQVHRVAPEHLLILQDFLSLIREIIPFNVYPKNIIPEVICGKNLANLGFYRSIE
jgi:hypothetical protein